MSVCVCFAPAHALQIANKKKAHKSDAKASTTYFHFWMIVVVQKCSTVKKMAKEEAKTWHLFTRDGKLAGHLSVGLSATIPFHSIAFVCWIPRQSRADPPNWHRQNTLHDYLRVATTTQCKKNPPQPLPQSAATTSTTTTTTTTTSTSTSTKGQFGPLNITIIWVDRQATEDRDCEDWHDDNDSSNSNSNNGGGGGGSSSHCQQLVTGHPRTALDSCYQPIFPVTVGKLCSLMMVITKKEKEGEGRGGKKKKSKSEIADSELSGRLTSSTSQLVTVS